MPNLVECPGEAHILDCDFNPTTQGPYGPGYHDCELCDDECYITETEYQFWLEEQVLDKLERKPAK